MKVNILGTEYTITIKKYDEDKTFAEKSLCGYCNGLTKEIVLLDLHTDTAWEYEPETAIVACHNETLRHEIIHAFFNESGLSNSSLVYGGAWAKNEEMVDWIALQAPKMYKAFEQAGCL